MCARLGHRAEEGEIVRFRPTAGEDDFFRLRVNQGSNLASRRLNCLARLASARMA
jgi:hypothetical protein